LAQHFTSRTKQQAVKNFAFDQGRQDWDVFRFIEQPD
jgi:hypothetical protein